MPLIKFISVSEDKGEEKTSTAELCTVLTVISCCKISVHSHHQCVELLLCWAISRAMQNVRSQVCWELGPGPLCFGLGAAPELRYGLGCAVGMPGPASPDLTWLDELLSWTSHFLRFAGELLAGPGLCQGPCLLGISEALPALPPQPHCPCGVALPAAY